MARYSVPGTEANAMILAVDEVCANLIIHAHDCNVNDHIELRVNVENGKEFTFDILYNAICTRACVVVASRYIVMLT